MLTHYKLDDAGNPIKCESMLEWCKWAASRPDGGYQHISDDYINGIHISTVFLNFDHRSFGDGPPLLWETMVFGGKHSHKQTRYSTKAEALAGHALMCDMARQALLDSKPQTETGDDET